MRLNADFRSKLFTDHMFQFRKVSELSTGRGTVRRLYECIDCAKGAIVAMLQNYLHS